MRSNRRAPPEVHRAREPARIALGRIDGAYGIRGWVRVSAWTDEPEGIFQYAHWYLGEASEPVEVLAGRRQGKRLVARLAGIDERDAAAALAGSTVHVDRAALPETAPGEYYWCDLLGLEVVNREGDSLGTVHEMMATGANDVMVVVGQRQRMVPFVPGQYVDAVEFDAGRIRVDWDPED